MRDWHESVPEETLTREEAVGVLRRLARMLRPLRGRITRAVAMLALQAGAVLAGPLLVRYGIDEGVQAGDGDVLNRAVIAYLAIALAGVLVGRWGILLVARVGEQFLRDLRSRVFRHLMGLHLGFFEREKTGRLVSRMTADVDALQELVSQGLVLAVMNLLLFSGAVVLILVTSWQLALFTLILVPPVWVATRWFRRRSNVAYLEVRDRVSTNLSTLQEGLAGIRVVQAFRRERAFADRFGTTNEAQFGAQLETVRISSKYFPVIEFAAVGGTAIIVGFGGWMVFGGVPGVTVGTVAAFVLWLTNLFEPMQQLSQLYNTVQQSGAALQKLFDLLDTETKVAERPGAIDLPARGAIEVDDVSFAYDQEPVLRDVSLEIAAGERLALVGPTGAGKSTLAKLLVRFYDPVEGAVRFGGVDLRDATIASLRDRMVVVPQEGFLFSGTLRDNMIVGRPDATDADIERAIAALGLEKHFAAFAEGLDLEVRERGSRLSAGQRQLVSLVRAALADPPVLVLDEATSNLDPGTEQAVEQALERLTEGRTVVVVAHRLTTASRADRIAVVDGGRVVELGSHDELLALDGRYAALYASWVAHHPEDPQRSASTG